MLAFNLNSLTGEQATSLSRPDIFQRIRVKPPYYALEQERLVGGTFCAEARAELAQGRAVGPMRPAEVSRHGAIAGSCAIALAQQDDKPRYYLAVQASYEGFAVAAAYGVDVHFEAEVKELKRRQATAVVRASIAGQPLAYIEVTYTIVSPSVFARLNGERRRATTGIEELAPLTDHPVRWRDNVGVCTVPDFPLDTCAGHFDEYPAAPVALLMDQLGYVVDASLASAAYVVKGEVRAERLCWAGEDVRFTMRKAIDDSEQALFEGGIESNGVTIGTMKLWMQYDPEGELSADPVSWGYEEAAAVAARRLAA